jgi:hypothetical protein
MRTSIMYDQLHVEIRFLYDLMRLSLATEHGSEHRLIRAPQALICVRTHKLLICGYEYQPVDVHKWRNGVRDG